MKRRSISAWTALIAAAAAATVLAASPPTAAVASRPLPERLAHVGASRQVVVVTAANWDTSYAKLQTWQRSKAGDWRKVMGPVAARIGWSGFRRADNRRQGSGKTPAGTFDIVRGFGLVEPSGVDIPYRIVDGNDWWPYDPKDEKTYNVFQFHRVDQTRWRESWAERLASYQRQYRLALILDFNLPSGVVVRNGQRVATEPADTAKGGGIFLHVNGTGATAGCVSISRAQMRKVVRWVKPGLDPVIVMGPRDVITRM